MKPVATHGARINDFCTWRGLLVLAGTRPDASPDGHYYRAADDAAAAGLWFGAIDDLYKLGAPAGEGGPWKDTAVRAGEASDPYLTAGFGNEAVTLSHDGRQPVRFTIEVDFLANGSWRRYAVVEGPAGKGVTHAVSRRLCRALGADRQRSQRQSDSLVQIDWTAASDEGHRWLVSPRDTRCWLLGIGVWFQADYSSLTNASPFSDSW